ncbi:MAG: vitamin B12-dependent ribonucleotide reductase [Chloroflexi bacterium]|nr:vitamin B12-dependent ribonucleotide reductase [Chloroflexota bacterium]
MTATDDALLAVESPEESATDVALQEELRSPATPPLIERFFTTPDRHPYDGVAWELRTAQITSDGGKLLFEQKDVEVPAAWSVNATNIVVSKYFYGDVDAPERERSVKQLVDRVAATIANWGLEGGYFGTVEERETFEQELRHLLINQCAAFNSPVWFNVGVVERPQCSACFINSVDDTMESIMDLATREALLFKWGSGTGSNLSSLRSSREKLTGGGTPSGPVSFMRGYDAFANVIKSGGKTRRAAKMVILNADHPDVMEFVHCKSKEEQKAWALIDSGYDGSLNGEAYSSISFQNANHSVRVTDAFMRAVEQDATYWTTAVTTKEPVEELSARAVLRAIAEATYVCGDPGMQFDTTINDWHTCAGTDRIYASNPCSEYMFLDDTACNLASINLLKFYDLDAHTFDIDAFRAACKVLITAQEILVDNASYPSKRIEENSHHYRPLGLGYANLGALLMARGLPYDSSEGRAMAGAITAAMTGEAYAQSARVAERLGAFARYQENRESFLRVIKKHRGQVAQIEALDTVPADLAAGAQETWDEALRLGLLYGYRNAQATVLAPTGTIAFMMDCDTTGIEPDIALVKYKNLSGGGYLKIVNNTVPAALRRLGYDSAATEAIVAYIDERGTIEGAPGLREADLSVFDCAFKSAEGERSIEPMAHVRMMGAAQPFLSGAISKTVNVPEDVTIDEIMETYVQAWQLGVKAIAIYRDNSKRIQPLETVERKDGTKVGEASTMALSSSADEPTVVDAATGPPAYRRHRLPDDRRAVTHKFTIGEHEGYLTVGEYENGQPGEVFVHVSKEGSTVSGLVDAVGALTSVALQSGVPIETLVRKFSHSRFEPSGWTRNLELGHASSILDYVFRWMGRRYLPDDERDVTAAQAPLPLQEGEPSPPEASSAGSVAVPDFLSSYPSANGSARERSDLDAPPCSDCGHMMVRNGSCFACLNCGNTSGCS